MSKNIKKLIKENLNQLLETKGFEEMEVAFGLKEKSDNLSDAEKKQFEEMKSVQDKETGVINLGDSTVQPALNKVHKEDAKDADDYYKAVAKKMLGFQETSESEETQIGESTTLKEEVNTDLTLKNYTKKAYEKLSKMGAKVRANVDGKVIGEQDGNKAHVIMFVKDGVLSISIKVNEQMTMEKAIKILNDLQNDMPEASSPEGAKDGRVVPPEANIKLQIKGDNKLFGEGLEDIPKVNRKDDQLEDEEVYDVEALGPGMLALKYDNEGTPVHKRFEERMEDMNGDDLTYQKLKGNSEKYKKHKYEKPDEYQKPPKVRVTNEDIYKYSDVIKENIFKVKGEIKSKEQVIKLTNKLPERVKVNETEFAVTDGENFYKLIWEGDTNGEAVIIREKNTRLVNESIDKMKSLWGYKSSNTTSTKKTIKENTDESFYKMMNKVRGLVKENEGEHSQEEMNDVWDKLNRLDDDDVFDLMEKTFNEESMSVGQFVESLPTHFGYDTPYLISVLKQIQEEGI